MKSLATLHDGVRPSASDIASLGLVALESLQKSPVFGGANTFEMLEQIRKLEIPDWSALLITFKWLN
jgi:hypothetical protein